MGGGGRRNTTHGSSNSGNKSGKSKSKQRWKPDTSSSTGGRVRNSFFVEGGILSDWQQQQLHSFSKGRKPSLNSNSDSKSGNSNLSKASGSKSESKKSNGNAFAYQYPSPDLKELCVGMNVKDVYLDELQPIVLVDSQNSNVVGYVDQTPDSKPQNVSYSYVYDSSFVLGDSSHRGLGFVDESEATLSGMDSSSRQMKEHEISGSDSPSFKMDTDENINCEEDVEELGDKSLSTKKNSISSQLEA